MLDLQIAQTRIEVGVSGDRLGLLAGEDAVGVGLLALYGRRHGPVLAQRDTQRGARAKGLDVVVVVLRRAEITGIGRGILRRRPIVFGETASGRTVGIGRRIGQRAGNIVEIAGVFLVPADQPEGCRGTYRYVDETLARVAHASVIHVIAL